MMDDFLQEAQGDWRLQPASQGPAIDRIRRRLRRTRWLPHLLMGLEIMGGVIAIFLGLWFASMAREQRDLLFTLSAAVMLLVAPSLVLASIMARRRWEDETPESILRTSLARTDASLAAVRLGRWHCAVIAGFVVLLWITQAAGLIDAKRFLLFYTTVCAAILLFYLPWLSWRKWRLLQERKNCQRLLEDLQASDITDGG
jgi:MFS family permease